MGSLIDSPWKVLLLAAAVALCGWAGRAIGVRKGMPAEGLWLGLLLGILGVLFIAVVPSGTEGKARAAQRRMEKQRRRAEIDQQAAARMQASSTPSPYDQPPGR